MLENKEPRTTLGEIWNSSSTHSLENTTKYFPFRDDQSFIAKYIGGKKNDRGMPVNE